MGEDGGSRPLTIICPGHAQVLLEGLFNFLQTQHKTDFDLELGSEKRKAHRLVLEVFLRSDKIPCSSDKQGQGLDDDDGGENDGNSSSVLDSVLEFIYTGAVTVPVERRGELLAAALELDFQMLADAVESASNNLEIEFPKLRRSSTVRRCRTNQRRSAVKDANEVAVPVESFLELLDGSADSHFDGSVSKEDSDRDDGDSDSDDCYIPDSETKSKTAKKAKKVKEKAASRIVERRELRQRSLRSARRPVPVKAKQVKKFKCPECSFVSAKSVELQRHQTAKHLKRCPQCSLTFGPKEHLLKHLELAHANLAPNLSAENKEDPVSGLLNSVSSAAASSELPPAKRSSATLKCFRCEFQTTVMSVYRRHLGATHGVTVTGEPAPVYKCTDCDYSSTNMTYFKSHRKLSHAKEKPFKCPNCDYATARSYYLTTHLNVVHGLGSSQVLCETCGKRCQSGAALIVHNRIHTQEKPFTCVHCAATFSTNGKLTRHVGFVHGLGPNQFTCETCGHRSSCRKDLFVHQRVHSQEKPFKCPHCSHACKDKGKLNFHISIVHGVGPSKFTCETCGKRCHSQSRLLLHGRTHTRERPFKCPHCAEAFVGKFGLKKHLSVSHGVGSNRFACETCGEWCGSQTALLIHGRTHTNERPFKCHVCSYASIHSGNLKTHLKNVHKIRMDPITTN